MSEPEDGARYDLLKASAHSASVIHCKGFGSFLADKFADMAHGAGGRDRVRVGFVEIGHHTMAVRLKLSMEKGTPRYVVTFFDANRPNGHTRLQKPEIPQLCKYRLEDFV